jgi:hypothetical protein
MFKDKTRLRKVLIVKGLVTVGVLAVLFLPNVGVLVPVLTNMIWIWVET